MSHSKLNLAIVMTRSITFIAACVVMMTAANVFAAIITQPTSLNPGDTYRLAFVTSTVRDATSTNIADYNTFVTLAANAVPALASLGTGPTFRDALETQKVCDTVLVSAKEKQWREVK